MIAELAAQPTDPAIQAAVSVQLRKVAGEEVEFARALAGLPAVLPTVGQNANVAGNDNIVGQAHRGSGVSITRT